MKALMKSDTLHLVFTSSRLQKHRGKIDEVVSLQRFQTCGLVERKLMVHGARRYLSRALDRAFCRLVEAAGKGNLTAMLRQ